MLSSGAALDIEMTYLRDWDAIVDVVMSRRLCRVLVRIATHYAATTLTILRPWAGIRGLRICHSLRHHTLTDSQAIG
jgi:hypothetical protein